MARRTPREILTDETARLELEKVRLQRGILKLRKRAMRQGAKMLSAHAAAQKNRLTHDWPTKSYSADGEIIADLATINARARQMRRDNGIIASLVGAFRRKVVGIGITPRSAARDPQTGAELGDFNDRIDRLWAPWARSAALCDTEKRHSFVELEGLVAEEIATVGEAIAILTYWPRKDSVGLRVQMVEPEMLDTSKMRNDKTGNAVRGGVEVNAFGAAVAYWIYTKEHPLNEWNTSSTRIPAWRVLHVMRTKRVRQTRGISLLAPVLIKARHLAMYDEYQLIAARLEACIGGVIERDASIGETDIGLTPLSGDTGETSANDDEVIFEPGMLPRLKPGEKINFNTPTKPGGEYDKFRVAQISDIAAGVGLDYATVARDFSKGNFSSQRQGLLEVWAETDPLQVLLTDLFCRPIREAFKRYAILEGRVAAAGFEDAETATAYLEDEWTGPPKPWIDPARQAAAAKIAIEQRFRTRREIINEQGGNVYDVLRQHSDEQRFAAELDPPVALPDAGGDPKTDPTEPRPGYERDPAGDGEQQPETEQNAQDVGDRMWEQAL